MSSSFSNGAHFGGSTSGDAPNSLHSPAPIRIQRKLSATEKPACPPPSVPPPEESSTDDERAANTANYSSTSTASAANGRDRDQPVRVSTLKEIEKRPSEWEVLQREEKERKQRERIERERRELEERRVRTDDGSAKVDELRKIPTTTAAMPSGHPNVGERTSYVEEPPSTTTTLERRERKAEKALVRRITNEMQLATYVHKVEVSNVKHPVGAYTPGVYRIRSLRFFEGGLRRLLWSLGKFLANRPFLSVLIAVGCFLMALSLPMYRRDQIYVDSPFGHVLGTASDVISNGLGVSAPKQPDFNYSNPAFSCIDWRDEHRYAVIIRTMSQRDTVLRKDAVLAYAALKKKLDHFPVEKREFLVPCLPECETDRDMVDRIIRKSPQVALTYPETFVSMSKESTNLTRVHLGAAIGGVETDTDGAISRAAALLMNFEMREDLSIEEQLAWQQHFDEQVRLTAAPNVTLMSWSPDVFNSSVISTIRDQYWWLLLCAAILFVFCVVSSFGVNAYQSKPLVGLMTFVSLIVAAVTGAAMQFYRDTSVDPLVWPIVFTVVGIGLVWLEHLQGSWARFSSAAVHPTEKIAFVLAHDGPGIAAAAAVLTLTFLTMGFVVSNAHMAAAFLGVAASAAILLVFAVLFVAVFVFIGGRREAKGVKWYQLCKTGDTQFTAPQLSSFDSASLFGLHDRLLDARPSTSRRIGAQLIARSMRYPIVFFCTAYLIFAVWGCANMRVDIKEDYFLPRTSAATKFIEQYREQFGKTTRFLEVCSSRILLETKTQSVDSEGMNGVEVTIESTVEYHEDSVQAAIFDLLDSAVNEGYATRSINWLDEFVKFEKASIYDVNPDTFVPVVHLVFLASEPYRRYSSDIVLDRFQTQIVKSRMYLELTPNGYNNRVSLVEQLLSKAAERGLPLSIKVPASMSLRHDMGALSSGLYAFGVALVSLFVLSLLFLGQPVLTFLLLFTSIAVLVETVGYAVHWGVPLNVITLTMALAGNALTCTVVMAFCYSYSMSGKAQIRAGVRIQYTFQATLVPVVFGCVLPVVTYLPMFAVDAPIVSHIWKMLVLNAAASLIHYLFFLPNLMLLLSEHFSLGFSSLNCAECCCDMDDDSSIYYIPTGGRAIHPAEGIYQHPSYTYSVPKTMLNASPPHYLAIAGPPSVATYVPHDYAQQGRHSRRTRRQSQSSGVGSEAATPRRERDSKRQRRNRRAASRDSEIYEAPPSPRVTTSSRSNSPRRTHYERAGPRPMHPPPATYYDESSQGGDGHPWRPYAPPQPFIFYPAPGGVFPQRR